MFSLGNGVKLFFEVHGDGFPLAMIEGVILAGCDLSRLASSPRGLPCVVFNRGAGLSDKHDEPYSAEIFAEDLRELLDSLGFERCHVLGFLWGFIAQEFALRYPGRAAGLVLVLTHFGGMRPC